ncbi:MAG: glycosyltransferase, partial [Candidatus Moraniibacteriota bacterium]
TYIDNRWPMFSVVSVLYNKASEVEFFLESFSRQEYLGLFEIIFIDDISPDDSVAVVEKWMKNAKEGSREIPEIKIIRNEKNIGNCGSRNRGILESRGDIVIVIDADCVVNKTFLKNHANAYFCNDCDVAVGPFNLETQEREPIEVLNYYENNLGEAELNAQFQDSVNKKSFLNCITRNFSIRRGFIAGDLFDEKFSYSKAEDSGFGWEDIEMGYRLYKRNVRIKYLKNAFSVHVSHPPTIDRKMIPLKSLKNFRRLFEKHPELLFVSRNWALTTFEKIRNWVKSENLQKNEDLEFLENKFQRFTGNPFALKSEKRLKVISYRWHCTHQYEIYKLPFDFTLVTGIGTGMSECWDFERRPLPDNIEMCHIDDVDLADYDFAILHFDENVFAPENTNGVIGYDWGLSFHWFLKNVKLPMVAICHGTPQFYGQYNGDFAGHKLMEVMEEERKKVVDALKDTMVVVNSFQAQREWLFKKSNVIWHGFDPAEFPQGKYEKNILMMDEKAMSHRPHYNGFVVKNEVFKEMPMEYHYENLKVPSPDLFYEKDTNEYAFAKFDNYAKEIGRYRIYFNPTLRSPMPRTRAEAMLCGSVVVTTRNHDVELFIKNGVNGFYSNDPNELREYMIYLLENPEKAKEIGIAGRETAMDVFGNDRFLKNWEELILKVIKGQ